MRTKSLSFEGRVIERLISDDGFVNQFMCAVKSKAEGAIIDLNKVYENLHDEATLEEAKPYGREESDFALYGEDWESA